MLEAVYRFNIVLNLGLRKLQDDFHLELKPSRAYHKIDTFREEQMNGMQRKTLVSPWRMYCMYSSMKKGTSWAEAMSNSESHSLSHCRKSEDISQAVS